ncbi:hypothetical protein OUZ56_030386 [Daphnia magna]|uniref:Uncharacterized protein n=1 Tax=Daphnia magna TaxID=35525 RepID=A0ABQ9ZR60_9CRUS|nr:hypothetical protein OUZ56_030386 [Daphnia magna]
MFRVIDVTADVDNSLNKAEVEREKVAEEMPDVISKTWKSIHERLNQSQLDALRGWSIVRSLFSVVIN